MYDVFFTDKCKKDLKKLFQKQPRLRAKLNKQTKLLSKNPKHPSLRIHKLQGQNSWSLSINMSVRLIFTIRGSKIYCTQVGSHDEVYN